MSDKVLLHVEGSARGEWALAVAALLQRYMQAEITFLCTEETAPRLETILDRANAQWGLAWKGLPRVMRPGTAEEIILTEARAQPYDLIVLAPAGRLGLLRLLQGSRVGRVARAANASVLVARAPLRALERILVAIAGNPRSEDVLAEAMHFARAFRARLTVLHVLSAVPLTFAGLSEREPALADFLASDAMAARQMRETRAQLAAEGLEVDVRLRVGLVVEEILAEIAQEGYDLLVIGAHLPVRPLNGLVEDIANQLICFSPISTLAVRPPA